MKKFTHRLHDWYIGSVVCDSQYSNSFLFMIILFFVMFILELSIVPSFLLMLGGYFYFDSLMTAREQINIGKGADPDMETSITDARAKKSEHRIMLAILGTLILHVLYTIFV